MRLEYNQYYVLKSGQSVGPLVKTETGSSLDDTHPYQDEETRMCWTEDGIYMEDGKVSDQDILAHLSVLQGNPTLIPQPTPPAPWEIKPSTWVRLRGGEKRWVVGQRTNGDWRLEDENGCESERYPSGKYRTSGSSDNDIVGPWTEPVHELKTIKLWIAMKKDGKINSTYTDEGCAKKFAKDLEVVELTGVTTRKYPK